MTRFLRPGRILRGTHATWLIDESWRMAAMLADDGPITLLSWPWPWPWPRLASDADEHGVLADGVGIVIQHGDQVTWVRREGSTVAQVDADLTLVAADPRTAWLVDRTHIDPGHPPAAPPPLPPGRIVAVRRDGSSTQVSTPAPVRSLALPGTDVWAILSEPPAARPGWRGSWWFSYPSAVFRAARDALLAEGWTTAAPTTDEAPRHGSPHPSAWSWLDDDPGLVMRHGVPAGGLRWMAGAPEDGDRIERRAVVIGCDPSTGLPSVRVDLGPGLVRDVQAVGREVWLVVARRRHLAVPHDRGVDVVAVSASGDVRTVLPADSIDISQFAPPRRRPPDEQIREHVEDIRGRFDDLDHFWRSEDGTTRPLSNGLTDGAVEVVGEWPDARVVVTMRHTRRPGLLLRRRFDLFADDGSPVEYPYADVHLMEDLDTGYIAPADEAVDGILDT